MEFTVKDWVKFSGGQLISGNPDALIYHVVFDTRSHFEPVGSLFIAIKGKRTDGHNWLEEAYSMGIKTFLVSEVPAKPLPEEVSIIKVNNTVRAFQKVVSVFRKGFSIPVIGITGSNGKTVVKEWLSTLLSESYNVVKSPRSFNSQIGVPLSVMEMNEAHTLGIFEAGISEPDEMEHLEKVIQPTIGVFTNVGEAHAEGFLNERHKIREKLRLFINADILIYCSDYHNITQSILEIKHTLLKENSGKEKFKMFSWSYKQEADLKISMVYRDEASTTLYGNFDGEDISITIPFTDRASEENTITCWAVMLYMGIPPEVYKPAFLSLAPVAMRMELKDAINNCSLINDSYNSDTGSLGIALDFLKQQKQHHKKTIILSDILQTGKPESTLYEEVAQLILQSGVTRFIGIGKSLSLNKRYFVQAIPETHFFENTEDFLKSVYSFDFNNETILLKGARRFEFERISLLLEQKAHKTVLEINLSSLGKNIKAYQALLKPNVRLNTMVKAFSYGSGTFEIANVLQFNRVDYLTVAYIDEGVALRKSGISLPVIVMNPDEGSLPLMIHHYLEPEIFSITLLKKFAAIASDMGYDKAKAYPIHIELDTGMHRLGFRDYEMDALKAEIKTSQSVKLKSVFSHLTSSEDPKDDEFTRLQIGQFKEMADHLCSGFKHKVLRHICNSAAIIRFPEAHFDMVRLGLGLYGIDATHQMKGKLEPIGTLKTYISQIKEIEEGEPVGYNRKTIVNRHTKIAVVGIGYADGIDRRLGNGKGYMMVRGKPAYVIGNVCMDMTMLDITDIEGVREGDIVEVFGKSLPVETLAELTATIPYEIITGISSRVKRVYFQE